MDEQQNSTPGIDPQVPDLTVDQLRYEFRLFLDTFKSGYPVIPAIKAIRAIFSKPGATYGLKDAKDLFEATIGRIIREAQRNDVAQLKSDLEYERNRNVEAARNLDAVFSQRRDLEKRVDELEDKLLHANAAKAQAEMAQDMEHADVVLLAECLDATGFPSDAINRIVGEEIV